MKRLWINFRALFKQIFEKRLIWSVLAAFPYTSLNIFIDFHQFSYMIIGFSSMKMGKNGPIKTPISTNNIYFASMKNMPNSSVVICFHLSLQVYPKPCFSRGFRNVKPIIIYDHIRLSMKWINLWTLSYVSWETKFIDEHRWN